MSFIEPLNKIKFEELITNTESFIFVDFYADWCGPCVRMLPMIEQLAKDEELAGKVTMYKSNVDYESDLAELFKVTGIPALHLVQTYKDKPFEIIKSWVGIQDVYKLKNEILFSIDADKKEVKVVQEKPKELIKEETIATETTKEVENDKSTSEKTTNKLKQKSTRALGNKKPFANFKFEIDNSGNYREEWFKFKGDKFIF